jgi:hypothetical protein
MKASGADSHPERSAGPRDGLEPHAARATAKELAP